MLKCRNVTLFLIMLVGSAISIPKNIPYQGVLTDNNGVVKSDGNYRLIFSLFKVSTAGTALIADTQTVVVSGGVFSVMIGDSIKTGKGLNLPFNEQYWLEVKMAGGAALTPRIKIGASAYAMRAANADSADYVKNIGTLSNQLRSSLDASDGDPKNAVVVDEKGFVGIGTIAPKAILSLAGKYNSFADLLYIKDSSTENNVFIGLTLGAYGPNDKSTKNSSTFIQMSARDPVLSNTGHGGVGYIVVRPGEKNVTYGSSDMEFYLRDDTPPFTFQGDPTNPSYFQMIPKVKIKSNGNFGIGTGVNANATLAVGDSVSSTPELLLCGLDYDRNQADDPKSGIALLTGHNLLDNKQLWIANSNRLDKNSENCVIRIIPNSPFSSIDCMATDGKTSKNLVLNPNGGNIGINTLTAPEYSLDVNGVIRSLNIAVSSDLRLKTSINSVSNPLSKLDSITGITYEWNREKFPERNFPEGKQIGVIAQDVEKVLPELVHTDSEGYKSVSYDKLTAVLIEAVKELKSRVEKQGGEIEQLKQELETLRK